MTKRAVCVGINDYSARSDCVTLPDARPDGEAWAQLLVDAFAFDADKVTLITDKMRAARPCCPHCQPCCGNQRPAMSPVSSSPAMAVAIALRTGRILKPSAVPTRAATSRTGKSMSSRAHFRLIS